MIIIISGKQGSGKDTLSNALKEQIEQRLKRKVFQHKFAKTIYEIHDTTLGILKKYGVNVEKDKYGDLLQYLGTEFGRNNFGTDVWCAITKYLIQSDLASHPNSVCIVSDCRFENEFDFFPEALRIRLECDEGVRKPRTHSWRTNTKHPSEVGLDKYSGKMGKIKKLAAMLRLMDAPPNLFDLTFDTGKESVNHCVEMILHEFVHNDFLQRRGLHGNEINRDASFGGREY